MILRATDLPVSYNAASILEHNLVERSQKTALFSLERTLLTRQPDTPLRSLCPISKSSMLSLRCGSASLGGKNLPAAIWEQWLDRTGIKILNGVGCTEVYHNFISNRPDDMLKVSGIWVSPMEVEATLIKHPADRMRSDRLARRG